MPPRKTDDMTPEQVADYLGKLRGKPLPVRRVAPKRRKPTVKGRSTPKIDPDKPVTILLYGTHCLGGEMFGPGKVTVESRTVPEIKTVTITENGKTFKREEPTGREVTISAREIAEALVSADEHARSYDENWKNEKAILIQGRRARGEGQHTANQVDPSIFQAPEIGAPEAGFVARGASTNRVSLDRATQVLHWND